MPYQGYYQYMADLARQQQSQQQSLLDATIFQPQSQVRQSKAPAPSPSGNVPESKGMETWMTTLMGIQAGLGSLQSLLAPEKETKAVSLGGKNVIMPTHEMFYNAPTGYQSLLAQYLQGSNLR